MQNSSEIKNVSLYERAEKMMSKSLILQGTGTFLGYYITLVAGSAAVQPLGLGLAGVMFHITRKSLFYSMEPSIGFYDQHKTAANVMKLGFALLSGCAAGTAYLMLAPLTFKALLIINLTVLLSGIIAIQMTRFAKPKSDQVSES